jgi:predicted dehydrogenase
VAVGADCRMGARAPWGGLELYAANGALEITDVDHASGYPTRFAIHQRGGASEEVAATLADQPYLRGPHLSIEEPHVYVDIMDLVDAIEEDRPPRATGEQARHVVEIIERAHTAARTGQAQTLTSSF